MKIGIIDLCKQIEDPRMNRKKVHKMETIIYISIAAVICGAQSWNEIEEFGNSKIAFFKSRIPGLEFIPSHDTFNRFFSMIKPDYFDMLLLASTSELESAPHDMVTLTYPIRPNDLASTVEMMLTQLDRRLKKRKSQPKKRTEQEQNYINNAKWLLMERNHMTEQEAFRYIQKSSMDSGTNMVETAQMILLLIYDG